MGEVLSVMLLLLCGMICISAGIYLTFGAGPGVIAVGICCLIAALVIVRGMARA